MLVSSAMNPIVEIGEWVCHHDLALSVSFVHGSYRAELTPRSGVGAKARAEAEDFDEAVIRVCNSYEVGCA